MQLCKDCVWLPINLVWLQINLFKRVCHYSRFIIEYLEAHIVCSVLPKDLRYHVTNSCVTPIVKSNILKLICECFLSILTAALRPYEKHAINKSKQTQGKPDDI